MARYLTIVLEGDPLLRQECVTVRRFNETLHELLDDMKATMYHANGCGLAAPQVGIGKRVVVLDDGETGFMELINPVIVERSGAEEDTEYCLSVPDRGGRVIRSTDIIVNYQDRNGQHCTVHPTGWTARIYQHEIDHLDGRLFTDVMIREVRD